MQDAAEGTASSPWSREVVLGLVASVATISIVGTALSLTGPLLGLVLERQGVSDALIGANTATAGIAAIATTPLVPRLTQRYGAAYLTVTAMLVSLASLVAMYLWQNVWFWFPLRFILTGAITFIFVISEFWINSLAPDGRRGLVMGIYATVLSGGFALGPAVLSVVGSAGAAAWLLSFAIFIAGLVPVWRARRTAPVIAADHKSSLWPFIFAVPIATFGVFVFGAAEQSSFAFLALYGLRLGFDESTAVNLVTLMALGGLIVLMPLGYIADMVDRRKLLLFCGLVGTAGIILLPVLADQPILRSIVLLVWGGVAAGLYTVGLTHLGARFSGGDLASANAAFIFMYAVGMLVGPATAGLAMEVWDPHGFAATLAFGFFCFSLLVVWRMIRPGADRQIA